MALSQNPAGGFARFPREIRDMVFAQVASAAGVRCHRYHPFSLEVCDEQGYAGCIKMLHEWASRSYIAKAACEELWASGPFWCEWYPGSDVLIHPKAPLHQHMRSVGPQPIVSLGAPINLGDCLRDIRLKVDPLLDDPLEDQENLHKLRRELTEFTKFPRLHWLQIDFWIPKEGDAYYKGLVLVESLLSPCRELRRHLGANFNVTIIRDWLIDDIAKKAEFIERYNISWMWDPPKYVPRANISAGLADVEEHIKSLIVDGADPDGPYTLLQELQTAASRLPQKKEEIIRMKDWSVGFGVSMKDWLWLKEHWRKE